MTLFKSQSILFGFYKQRENLDTLFEERDTELKCTRTITAEIAVCHYSDETGVRHDLGLEVTLHLPLDNDEHYYEYTFSLEKPEANTPLERPLTLNDVAIALSIDPNEQIWQE